MLFIKKNKIINTKFWNNSSILYKKKKIHLFIFFLIIIISEYKKIENDIQINNNYLKLQLELNLTFSNQLKNKINLAIYYTSIKNGGVERLTALLLNYFDKIKIFNLFLITQKQKEENEYNIPFNIKRIVINSKRKKELIKILKMKKITILIYHFYNELEINELNNIHNTKTIFYNHSCIFIWIYAHIYFYFKTIYNAYKNSQYIISLVPFENGYLFKKWGINSIFMNNFISFEYNYIIPSDLSSQTILMIGRGSDRMKRFDLGVKAMKYIIKIIPTCDMKIISNIYLIEYLQKLIKDFKLEKHVKFMGYSSVPEIYYKNASIHIFPSISESFGLVLSESKIFGIPNILVGLDYISIAKGGTIIIYDDNPISIAKEAIKLLKNEKYRKKLGREARKSMKKFKNELLLKKWTKLILSIYNGKNYYENLRKQEDKISEKDAINILKRQVKLLKIRQPKFKNITIKNIENFTFMKKLDTFN